MYHLITNSSYDARLFIFVPPDLCYWYGESCNFEGINWNSGWEWLAQWVPRCFQIKFVHKSIRRVKKYVHSKCLHPLNENIPKNIQAAAKVHLFVALFQNVCPSIRIVQESLHLCCVTTRPLEPEVTALKTREYDGKTQQINFSPISSAVIRNFISRINSFKFHPVQPPLKLPVAIALHLKFMAVMLNLKNKQQRSIN